jgi:hypothetical protein
VKLLPPLFPTWLHRLRGDRTESVRQTLRRLLVAVSGELQLVSVLPLLEPRGEEGDQRGAGLLRPPERQADNEPAEAAVVQRNAVRSFSKKPSSAL